MKKSTAARDESHSIYLVISNYVLLVKMVCELESCVDTARESGRPEGLRKRGFLLLFFMIFWYFYEFL